MGDSSTLSNSKGSATVLDLGINAEKVDLDCKSLAIMADPLLAVV